MRKSQSHFRLTLTLCFIALVASVAFNALLFAQARNFYLQLNETRLDPLGLRSFSTDSGQHDVPAPTKATVVFFGDSRAAQWPFPDQLKGFSFVNRGIPYQTTAQVLGRFDEHIAPLRPHIVVVQVGINDLKTIPLFPERKAAIIANCKANIRQMVARSVASGATVILTTIFPVGSVPLAWKPFWSSDVALAVNDVNNYLYSLKTSNIIIIDTYSLLAENGKTQNNYARDMLHLNAKGYEVLNSKLIDILARVK
jgi:lysophospholipase L1-like esterase